MQFPSGIFFDLQIENYVGFLGVGDLLNFELIETVGIELPEVELCFVTTDSKVKELVKEVNLIKILIGEDKSKYDTFTMTLLERPHVNMHQTGSYTCYFKGFIGSDKRLLVDKVQFGLNSNPIDGMQQVCNKYSSTYGATLNFDSSIPITPAISSQVQNWIAADESYRHLLVDMWSHLDLRPSFPLAAINRYSTLMLRDSNTTINNPVKWTFTQKNPTGKSNTPELCFINPFKVENHTEIYNLYAGYGKTVNIYDAEKGNYGVHVHDPDHLLGASLKLDLPKGGDRCLNGFKQSSNVTNNYQRSYFYNVGRLIALSNMYGFVDFPNTYNKNINLLDSVNLVLADSEQGKEWNGNYIIHTIVYNFSSVKPFLTRVYISRDCNNHIQDNIVRKNTGIPVPASTKEDILNNVKLASTLLAGVRGYVEGTLNDQILSYLASLKTNVLNSFSIYGTTIDLNSQLTAMQSLNQLGNNIFFKLLNAYVPTNLQYLFQQTGWGNNINLTNLLNSTLQLYLPEPYSGLYNELLLTINDINFHIQQTQEALQNATGVNTTMLASSDSTTSTQINKITNSMLSNVQQLNLPIPTINLTPSQQLLSGIALNTLVADIIISSLQQSGYLNGFDTSPTSTALLSINNFRNILLGITILDTTTANTITNNISSIVYNRFYGYYSDLNNLTEYNIKKGLQDWSRIPEFSKKIATKGGVGLYAALPSTFNNLVFDANTSLGKIVSINPGVNTIVVEGNCLPLIDVEINTYGDIDSVPDIDLLLDIDNLEIEVIEQQKVIVRGTGTILDGVYTTLEADYSDGKTTITVSETIPENYIYNSLGYIISMNTINNSIVINGDCTSFVTVGNTVIATNVSIELDGIYTIASLSYSKLTLETTIIVQENITNNYAYISGAQPYLMATFDISVQPNLIETLEMSSEPINLLLLDSFNNNISYNLYFSDLSNTNNLFSDVNLLFSSTQDG